MIAAEMKITDCKDYRVREIDENCMEDGRRWGDGRMSVTIGFLFAGCLGKAIGFLASWEDARSETGGLKLMSDECTEWNPQGPEVDYEKQQ